MAREFMPPTEFARMWRSQPTPAERALWNELRGSKIGYKFSRQVRIGDSYADFCCRSHRLVVEVDGEAHDGRRGLDQGRDAEMRSAGYEVLRFSNEQVMHHPEEVVKAILQSLGSRPQTRF